MRSRLLLAAMAALFFAYTVSLGQGQTATSEKHETVKIGIYRDLNFLRSVKLETAPYVNPDLLKRSATAYKFDVVVLSKASDTDRLKELFNDGKLALAVRDPKQGGWKVLSRAEVLTRIQGRSGALALQNNKDLPWVAAPENYILVSHMKRLGDVEAAGKIVSWSATKPVVRCDDCQPNNNDIPK